MTWACYVTPHDWEGLHSSRTHKTRHGMYHSIIIPYVIWFDNLTLFHGFLISSFTPPHLASNFVVRNHYNPRSLGLLLAACNSGVSYEPVIGRALNQDIPFGGLIVPLHCNSLRMGGRWVGWWVVCYVGTVVKHSRAILVYPLVHQPVENPT